MKKLISLILVASLSGCISTPVVITKTEIKYIDRVIVEPKLVCCNCEIVKKCPHEWKMETNGQLTNTMVCLREQKKVYNETIKGCSFD